MKLLPAICACISAITALPSSTTRNDVELSSLPLATPIVAIRNCEPGLAYCFAQIVNDLGSSFPPLSPLSTTSISATYFIVAVPKQTILHQYCDEQYTVDALSCHACHKLPWPLDYCWDGPGAWNSVFTCKGGQEYTFKERCDWCEAGRCT